ncbi:MAG: hypothetical protein CVU71_07490 [Deltaproteobacteria bacterium HGW-Deltaproteobacteria-6]|nr:MAG: hypothetical protein CVU71_07490 [Deltaproteobacteria bacterium HGW-Deltaproteobacteria-6]
MRRITVSIFLALSFPSLPEMNKTIAAAHAFRQAIAGSRFPDDARIFAVMAGFDLETVMAV